MIATNEYQTQLTDELLDSLHPEVRSELLDLIENVEFIKRLISPDRKRAKDLPRDKEGRIIVDLANPHILEDMDYFRPALLHYKEHGCYTKLKPNLNPRSEFSAFLRQEIERCWNGMVRPSDGEWIPGDLYYFLNYFPMEIIKHEKGSKIGIRVTDFPRVWEGIYWRSHYIHQARYGGMYDNFKGGKHSAEISSRMRGKSYYFAAVLTKLFLFGESSKAYRKVKGIIVADTTEFLVKDGTLHDKFTGALDFCRKHTPFPAALDRASVTDLQWISGYTDKDTGKENGSRNTIMGLAINKDPDKVRGKRCARMIFEEFGKFPSFLNTYQVSLPNVQDANVAFGQINITGTGGTEGNDFTGALEMIMYPDGYNIYSLPNVYDKGAVGKKRTIFMFPAYVNMQGFYNEDGVSDVTGAIISELNNRVQIKYSSSDPLTLTRRKAEYAFTIQDSIMKRSGNLYPSDKLNDRINELDLNPDSFNSMYEGRLTLSKGVVNFIPDNSIQAIQEFPHRDNKDKDGAVYISKMPVRNSNGQIPWGRYIAGIDPYDDDASETLSLGSIYVMDLFTDEIVCEYAGRPQYAEDFYEICRLILLFYNAEGNYENNKKGIFSYFSKHSSVHLLSPTLDFLKEKELMKPNLYGNKAYGTIATTPIKIYARRLIRDWLLKPSATMKEVIDGDGNRREVEVSEYNLNKIMYRALLKELSLWDPDGNYDRHDALAQLMLLREDKLRLAGESSYGDAIQRSTSGLEDDEFFIKNAPELNDI